MYFELGIRTSLDRPVVLVRDNLTTKIPFDTGPINTFTYDASLLAWTLQSQVNALSTHITEAARKAEGRNSLWRYFGLTQRAGPAEITNPQVAKLNLIVEEVNRLRDQLTSPSPEPDFYSSALSFEEERHSMHGKEVVLSGDVEANEAYLIVDRYKHNLLELSPPPEFARFITILTDVIPSWENINLRYDSSTNVLLIDTGEYRVRDSYINEIDRAAVRLSSKYLLFPDTRSPDSPT